MRESDWGRAGGHTWPVLDCFPFLGMHDFGLLGIVCAGLSLPLDSGFCSELWKHDDDDDDDCDRVAIMQVRQISKEGSEFLTMTT